MELVAEHIDKNFGRYQALSDVTFRLEGKGCFGYLGPNGAGKTTTMKIFTTLLRPDHGNAYVNGINVAQEPVSVLKLVGALIEDPEPYSFMNVGEFIVFATKVRNIPRYPDLKKLNETLDLPPLERKCGKLSKGQKRRVLIAALLAQDPEILILDEPSAGLDPAEAVVFRNLILQLKKDKLVFLSSHLLYEIDQMSDSVLFINRGKVLEQATIDEVKRKFGSRSLKVEFLTPIDERNIQGLVKTGYVLTYVREGDRTFVLTFDGSEDTRRKIVDFLYPLKVRNISDAQLSLEQAFMDLMKKE